MVDAWLVRGYMTAVEKRRKVMARESKVMREFQAAMHGKRSDLYDRACTRVACSPRLNKYYAIIMSDGFADSEDHLRWVIRGRVGEIEAWAQQIKEDSDG